MKKQITLFVLLFIFSINGNAQNNFFEGNVSSKWDDPANWSLGHPATGSETAMIDGTTCWVNVPVNEPDVLINGFDGGEFLVTEDAEFSKIQIFGAASYFEVSGGTTLTLNTDGSVPHPLHIDQGANMINDGDINTYAFLVGQFTPYTCHIENTGTIDFNGSIFGHRLSMGICEFVNYGTLTCGTIGAYDFLFCNGTTNEFYNYGTIIKTGLDDNAIHMKGLFENHGTIDILSEGFTANAKPTILNVGDFHNYGDITIDVDPNDADGIADEGIECISSPFTNHNGATITVKNTYLYGLSPLDAPGGTNKFVNQGTVVVSDIHGGGYAIYGTGTYRCENASYLDGIVFSQVDVEFESSSIHPGTSPGEIIFTTDQDFYNAKYNCEIEGTGGAGIDHDHIEVQGDAIIENLTLSVSLSNGFIPVANNEFVIFTTSNGGTIGNNPLIETILPGLTAGLVWNVRYTSTEIILEVLPESSSNNFFQANIDDTWSNPANWSLGHVPYDEETAFVDGQILVIDVPVVEPNVYIIASNQGEIYITKNTVLSKIRVWHEGSYLEIDSGITLEVNTDGTVSIPLGIDYGADMNNNGLIKTYNLTVGQFAPYTCEVENSGTIDFNGYIFGRRLVMGICTFTNNGTLTCDAIGAYDFLYCNGSTNEFYNYGSIIKVGACENAMHMKGLVENHGTIDILYEGFPGNEHSAIISVGDFHNYGDISIDVDPSDADGVAGYGLYSISNAFTNHPDATISIKNVLNYGMYITDDAAQDDPFINQGTVSISDVSGWGYALYGTGTYRCEGTSNLNGNVLSNLTVEFDGCTLSPGNSPGEIVFEDDQDFDGTTYLCEIEGNGGAAIGHDIIEVQGTASLSGASVEVSLLGGFIPSIGDSYTILTTTNGGAIDVANATFDMIDLPTLPATMEWEITYTLNDVILSVVEFEESFCPLFLENYFDASLGGWIDGGSDCRRSSNDSAFAYSGTKCIRLRDDSNTSKITSPVYDLSDYNKIVVNFTYIAESMEAGEGFLFEYSVDGGVVFVPALSFTVGSEFSNSTREFVSEELSAVFTDQTVIRFRCNAANNSDFVYIDDVVINACPIECAELAFNDFDSGWEGWSDGGSDCRRSTNDAAYANSGTRCVRLRDDSSTSTTTSPEYDMLGASSMSISFSYITASMEATESFFVQYSLDGGSTFITAQEYISGEDFDNGIRDFAIVSITDVLTSNTMVRFKCNASNNSDYVYIDDISISACVEEESAMQNNIIESEQIEIEETTNIKTEYRENKSLLLNNRNITVYPNPIHSSQMLNIAFEQSQHFETILVYNISGQLILTKQLDVEHDQHTLNLNSFEEGTYIFAFRNKEEVITKRIVITN